MPKFVADGNQQHIQAIKEFTDREEPRKVFWDKYHEVEQNLKTKESDREQKISVISYYGFGGIGKSSLLHKIQQEIAEKAPKTKSILVDFDRIADLGNNTLAVLRYIENELRDKYKFSFPVFDLVSFDYETKLGRNPTKDELQGILKINDDLDFALDIINEIPLIDVLPKILSLGNKASGFFMRRVRDAKLNDRAQSIKNLTVEQLQQQLPYYFAIDLKNNLLKEKHPLPFVFFFDTYEKLVNELVTFGNQIDNDLWIRGDDGLVLQVPNVIWVIAGREKLKWADIDSDWQGSLDQHLLGNLSFPDAKRFLEKANVTDQDLIHQIYDLTKGTPIFLDMCVDTHTNLLASGKTPTIEDFGQNTNDLTKRFFVYMDADDYDLCTALAFIGNWTDDNIEGRIKAIFGNFPVSRYETLRNSSFIVEESGQLKIHDVVKDVIIANTKELTRAKITKALQAETDEKIKNLSTPTADESTNQTKEERVLNALKAQSTHVADNSFEQLIDKLLINLTNCQNTDEFNRGTNYLITKIEKYQESLNKAYELPKGTLDAFDEYKDTVGYARLQCFTNLGPKEVYRQYEKLKNHFQDKDYKLPLRQYAHWHSDNCPEDKKDYHNKICGIAIEEKLDESLLIRLRYLINTASYLHENFNEFAEHITKYNPIKPTTLYFDLLITAADWDKIYNSYYDDSNDDYMGYSSSAAFDSTEEDLTKTVTKIIEQLTKHPQFFSVKALRQLTAVLGHKCCPTDLRSTIFEYLYSIRNTVFYTADLELLEGFGDSLINCLGGEEGEAYCIMNDNLLFEAKDCLEIVYDRYCELCGKDALPAVVLQNALAIQESIFENPDHFEEYIQSHIKKYGLLDDRTIDAHTKFCGRITKEHSYKTPFEQEADIIIILDRIAQPYFNLSVSSENEREKIQKVLNNTTNALYYIGARAGYPESVWNLIASHLDKNPDNLVLYNLLKSVVPSYYRDFEHRDPQLAKTLQYVYKVAYNTRFKSPTLDSNINYITHRQILECCRENLDLIQDYYDVDNTTAKQKFDFLFRIDELNDRDSHIYNGEETERIKASRELFEGIIKNKRLSKRGGGDSERDYYRDSKRELKAQERQYMRNLKNSTRIPKQPNAFDKLRDNANKTLKRFTASTADQIEEARVNMYITMLDILCYDKTKPEGFKYLQIAYKAILVNFPKAAKDQKFLAEYTKNQQIIKDCIETAQNDTDYNLES